MTLPSLRPERLVADGEMKTYDICDFCFDEYNVWGAAERTSRVSSRSSMHGRTVPSGSHVGTSFIEWTQMSTSSPRSATSSSFVKRPLPPISLSAYA